MQISHGHLYHAIIISMYQNWRSVKCYVIGMSDVSWMTHDHRREQFYNLPCEFCEVGVLNRDREWFCEYLLLQITLHPKFISNFWEIGTSNYKEIPRPNFIGRNQILKFRKIILNSVVSLWAKHILTTFVEDESNLLLWQEITTFSSLSI